MKFAALFICSLVSFSSMASEMIWSKSKIGTLNKQFVERNIYLQRRLLPDVKIDRLELGQSTSPYYEVNGVPKKDFKDYSKQCYTISFLSQTISAQKVACVEKKFEITFNDEVYVSVTSVEEFKDLNVKFAEKNYSKVFGAYHHLFRDLAENSRAELPYTDITVAVKEARSLKASKFALTLKTDVAVSRAPYAFLSDKVETTTQDLTFAPKAGDMIFKNGDKLLLLKRFQPAPFEFKILTQGDAYLTYLSTIEEKLYPFKGTKRCFRDALYEEGKFDCDKLIFKDKSAVGYADFSLIYVDLNESEILLK